MVKVKDLLDVMDLVRLPKAESHPQEAEQVVEGHRVEVHLVAAVEVIAETHLVKARGLTLGRRRERRVKDLNQRTRLEMKK